MAVGTVLVTVVTRGEDMIGGLLPEAFAHIMGGFGAGLLWPVDKRAEEGTVPPMIWAKASGNNPPIKPIQVLVKTYLDTFNRVLCFDPRGRVEIAETVGFKGQ
jgi:hypothetical protein